MGPVTRRIAQDLRRKRPLRIANQQSPDGLPYAKRKQRKNLRGKKGRIKRQKAATFEKIHTLKNLKIEQDENQLSVGFFGRVARIARVHQEGLSDKVTKKGPNYRYVEVIWDDATSHNESWVSKDEEVLPATVVTRGWLVADKETYVSLASSVSTDPEDIMVGNVSTVPRGMIKSMRDLRVSTAKPTKVN